MNLFFNQIQLLAWTLLCPGPDGMMEIPAIVPGAVQIDVAEALSYPDYREEVNYREYAWMEDVDFTYRTEFDTPKLRKGESLWFVSKGIDYECNISLNGHLLLEHVGSYSPVEVCLSEYLEKTSNVLEVLIKKVPKREGMPADRQQASNVCKAPAAYGWDWHPRLIPSGIWDETGLQVRSEAWIDKASLAYGLAEDFSAADISVSVGIGGVKRAGDTIKWRLLDASGSEVASASAPAGTVLTATLSNPELWWTYDHGTPYLYKSVVELVRKDGKTIDRSEEKVGFRRIRLVMNTDGWNSPQGPQKSRSEAPSQIELNGRRIFAKGTNWIAPEIFQGTIKPELYQELVGLCKEANFNTLRCWGGCGVGKDAFFSTCDSLGLIVWQEFPLACNDYPDEPHYLDVLHKEAVAIVSRLREHPSVGILCGGNELFNSWSGMTDQSLALRLLNSVCYEMAPSIPFLATSPLTGMAHGNYLFRMDGVEVYEWMNNSDYGAYCEFGVPSIAPLEVLRAIRPEGDLFPFEPDETWIDHHAFGAWDGNLETWLAPATIEYYFGKSSSIEQLIDRSSRLQAEGYKCIYEEARRKKPHCAMALNWCFNEPWPTAANNSIVAYPAVKKQAFADVSAACRPLLASARFDKYLWEEGDSLEFEMWLLNDTFGNNRPYTLTAILVAPDGTESELLNWMTPSTEDNRNVRGPVVRTILPSWDGANIFTVKIIVGGHPEMDSSYTLAYRKAEVKCTNHALNK